MPTKKITVKKIVKKPIAKKVAKKAVAKKAVKRTPRKKITPVAVQAVGEQCFWVCNGDVLASLTDLQQSLKKMNKASFTHHVSKDHNDFATWVDDILQNPVCANELRSKRTVATAATTIKKHLT